MLVILPMALLPLNYTRYCTLHTLCCLCVIDQVFFLLLQIQVERGFSFSDAVSLLNKEAYPGEGFYISKKV